MRKLSSLESTVLLGLNRGTAISNMWNQILAECEFGALPHSINRALPTIYKALDGHRDVPQYKRLAGVTKKNWIENMRRVERLIPVLVEADTKGVKVVVLKGLAISFLTKDFSSRVMGDSDLLIKAADKKEFLKILISLGFKPRFHSACFHREYTQDIFTDAFVDYSGNIIDVHTTGDFNYFYKEIWNNSVTIPYQDLTVNIPSEQHILLHSLKHGAREVASSDLMQTTLDFIALKKRVDADQLMAESVKWGCQNELSMMNRYLDIQVLPVLGRRRVNWGSTASRFMKFLKSSRFMKFLKLRRNRGVSYKLACQVSKNSNFYRPRYLLWILLFAPRPLEQKVIEKKLGFIKKFECIEKLSNPVLINSFRGLISKEKESYEIRFGVQGDFQKIVIDSYEHFFSPHLMFLNGKLAGIIQPNSSLVFNIDNFRSLRYEISIRKPYGRCNDCSEILGNSLIHFQ